MHILRKGIYLALAAVWIFAAICVSARPAYAYVDPGSGLFFLQVVGSTFLGFAFLVRRRVGQLFGLSARNEKAIHRDVAGD